MWSIFFVTLQYFSVMSHLRILQTKENLQTEGSGLIRLLNIKGILHICRRQLVIASASSICTDWLEPLLLAYTKFGCR